MLTRADAGHANRAGRRRHQSRGASHGGKGSDQSQHRPGGPGEGDRGVPGRGRRRRIRAADPDVPGQGSRPARAGRRAAGTACDGCPPLADLLGRYDKAGGQYMVCPVCFNAKKLDKASLLPNAELAGTVQLWNGSATKQRQPSATDARVRTRHMTRVPDRPQAGQSLRCPCPGASHGPRDRHQGTYRHRAIRREPTPGNGTPGTGSYAASPRTAKPQPAPDPLPHGTTTRAGRTTLTMVPVRPEQRRAGALRRPGYSVSRASKIDSIAAQAAAGLDGVSGSSRDLRAGDHRDVDYRAILRL